MLKRALQLLTEQEALTLTALRALMGIIIGYAGYLKVFEGDLAVEPFTRLGIPWPQVTGPLVSLLELGGGLALFLGVFTRTLGMVFALGFALAAVILFQGGGAEAPRLEMMLATGSLVLAAHGAGDFGGDRPGHPWEP